MKSLHSVSIAVFLLGLSIIASFASDAAEASILAPKDAGATNSPKGPKAVKPTVQKTSISSVKPVVKKLPESQKTSDQEIVQAVRILQSAQKTLALGDHDYGGHRANAVRDVGNAEKQLQEALKYRGQKSSSEKLPAPVWHPEPQKLSNAQLASKIPVLKATVALLKQGDGDYGGHRAKAAADLKIAVASLERALKFVKASK